MTQVPNIENGQGSVRLLRLQAVMDMTGCKRSKIYELVARGEFPRPVKIDSCAAWPEAEVRSWVLKRIAGR